MNMSLKRKMARCCMMFYLNNTDPKLVTWELDLGWVVASGNDPLAYFNKYPGRFPLWHLKDMDVAKTTKH